MNVTFKFTGRDTLKAVKQYIHNGLGLSKEDITKAIKDEAIRYVQDVQFDNIVRTMINVKVAEIINDVVKREFGYLPGEQLARIIRQRADKKINEMIDECIKTQFSEALKAGLQGMLNEVNNKNEN